MLIPCFSFSTFLIVMDREPKFKSVGIEKCKKIIISYPNGISSKTIDEFTDKKDMGKIFFQKDSTLFMMDVEEKEVIIKHMESNEYDVSKFCSTYFELKNRVEEIGGTLVDERF